jgi:hypothetical protein
VPWNFFYYPFHVKTDNDKRARLYNNPGAYTKFDAVFNLGTKSFDWETSEHKKENGAEWAGHCWGSALASIILQDPTSVRTFTQDELEGLSSEFFNESGATFLMNYEKFEKPKPGEDPTDDRVHKFHNGLRELLRTKKTSLHLNLRQESGTKANESDDQIWNQGCYTYSSSMMEDPGAAGDPIKEKIFQIKLDTSFVCNDDFLDPPNDNGVSKGNPKDYTNGRREQASTYILMYGNDGEIKPNGTIAGRKQDWQTMKLKHSFRQGDTNIDLFIPESMSDVSRAAADFKDGRAPAGRDSNPSVTADRLKKLGVKTN